MGDQQKDQSTQKPQTPPPGVSKEAKKPDLNQKPRMDDKELEDDDLDTEQSAIDKKKPQ